MQFLYSFFYILIVAIFVFLLGRLYPQRWLYVDRFPFKSFRFEKNGTIYNKLKIMKWKTKLPDASLIITKILPGFMPRKRLDDEKKIPILIRETCIAEATHVAAAILGFGCVFLWDGVGGWIMSILFLLINIPFIIMQRFNRPRLIAADMMLKRRNAETAMLRRAFVEMKRRQRKILKDHVQPSRRKRDEKDDDF